MTKPDFYNKSREGVLLMSVKDLALDMRRMKADECVDIYLSADKSTCECSNKVRIKRECWDKANFYLISGADSKVHIINHTVCTDGNIEKNLKILLKPMGLNEAIGMVVSRTRQLDASEVYEKIIQEQSKGYKCLLVYRNESELNDVFGTRLYHTCDTDGQFLCYLFDRDHELLYDQGRIIDANAVKDMCFKSDWAIANSGERDIVLAHRVAVVYTEEVIWCR